jgi:hypothetical protein
MKVDVEGAEHLVVSGAQDLLRSKRVRAVVFEDRRGANGDPTNEALLNQLRDAGYDVAPFALSDEHVDDGMFNFLATPSGRS